MSQAERPLLESLSPQLRAIVEGLGDLKAKKAGGDPAAKAEVLALAERLLAKQCIPRPPPRPHAPPEAKELRVAVVCMANGLVLDRVRHEQRVYSWSKRPTGEVVCTNALLRSLATWADLTTIALDVEGSWCVVDESFESIPVVRGQAKALAAALHGQTWDACIASSADHRLVRLCASLSARCNFAFVHHLVGLPWGPWSAPDGDAHTLAEDLAQMTLLCTSAYVRNYVRRFAPPIQRADVAYAADYGFFDACTHVIFEPWRHPAAAYQAVASTTARNAYATLISPCASCSLIPDCVRRCEAKGLQVLVALAKQLPTTPFLCVVTRWTQDADTAALFV